MIEEVIACEYSKCDVYLLKPGKSQCSYEGTEQCGAEDDYFSEVHLLRRAGDALAATGGQHGFDDALDNWKDIRTMIDKSKVSKIDKDTFNEIKDLEYNIKKLKKIADDWRQVAIALATDLGNADMAIDCYEDIRDGLYDTVRERMYVSPSTKQRVFDGIHDYATLISTKAGEAQELRVAAEDASDAENVYYWEGYEAALDFAIDSLPNYNN